MDEGGGEHDCDLDGHIDKFFGYELIGVKLWRGIIDVVVVEIEGVDVDVIVDVMYGKLIFLSPKLI